MAAEQKLPQPVDPVTSLINAGSMFGTGTTTSTSSSSQTDSADALIQSIMKSVDPEQLQNLVNAIFLKAKTALGPSIAQSIGTGNRALSDTSLAQIQSEAQARATAESAQAVLEAQTQAQRTAANLTEAKIQASKQTQTKTGVSPAGKGFLGLAALSQLKRLVPAGVSKNFWNPDAVEGAGEAPEELGFSPEQLANMAGPEQLAGPGIDAAGEAATDIIPGAEGLDLATLTGIEAGTTAEGIAAGITAADAAASADALDAAATGGSAATAGEVVGTGLIDTGIGAGVGLGIEGSIKGQGGALSEFSGGPVGAVGGSVAAGDDEGAVANFLTGGVSGTVNTVEHWFGF